MIDMKPTLKKSPKSWHCVTYCHVAFYLILTIIFIGKYYCQHIADEEIKAVVPLSWLRCSDIYIKIWLMPLLFNYFPIISLLLPFR